jgi:hypothetical protein
MAWPPPRPGPYAGDAERKAWLAHEQASVSEGICPHCLGPLVSFDHDFRRWDYYVRATVQHCRACNIQWHPVARLWDGFRDRTWIGDGFFGPGDHMWVEPPPPEPSGLPGSPCQPGPDLLL